MKTLILVVLISVTNLTIATPSGVHGGAIVTGPSGVVTNHGAIGPAALGLGGLGHGGAYLGGPVGPSAYVSGPVGPSAYVAGPAVSHSSIIGPAAGLGLGFGGFGGHGLFGGLGGFGGGLGWGGHGSGLGLAPGLAVTNGGGTINLGHHGVMVKGPRTVPATIAGPAGKVVADGLYGVPTHGHGW